MASRVPDLDGCQYGEEEIILPFFGDTRGCVVDVGAADGIAYSNSRFLIRDHGWRGVLIEPLPQQFAQLADLYRGNEDVRMVESAVSVAEGTGQLWPADLGSTLSREWRERTERVVPDMRYGNPLTVRTAPLSALLDEVGCAAIDFLTIDAEGMDLEALRSLDWSRWRPRLVCAESGAGLGTDHELFDFMASVGYVYHANTRGNTFWRTASVRRQS